MPEGERASTTRDERYQAGAQSIYVKRDTIESLGSYAVEGRSETGRQAGATDRGVGCGA